jgi:hypothetical protein
VDVVGVGVGADVRAPALGGPVGPPDAAVVDDVHHAQTPGHGEAAAARVGPEQPAEDPAGGGAVGGLLTVTVTAQSQARPSLCSLRPPIEQAREMSELWVAGNEARTIRWNPTTPGLGRGLQVVWGW